MKVEFVATGDTEDCGIATYTSSLESALDVSTERTPVKLRSPNVLHYVRQAIDALRSDADVVHVQHEYGIFGPLSIASWFVLSILGLGTWLSGRPVVVTVHTAWNEETVDPPLYWLKRHYVTLNNRLIARVADHLVFLSEDTRDLFATTVDLAEERVSVLPHGVQADLEPMDDSVAKQRIGVDPDADLVVEPGFVRPQKGYETLLEIAEYLPETTVLIGGGAQTEEYADYVDALRERAPDNVEITGVLDDDAFHALFNAMDVAVLPYETVSQSGILNWCIAYEVPTVASDLEHFRELRAEHGFPRLFDLDEPADGAEAVGDLLVDPDTQIGMMKTYKTAHGMDRIAERHREIYRSL
jgi:glycosyltransferase involved in cell wall biosynthesis